MPKTQRTIEDIIDAAVADVSALIDKTNRVSTVKILTRIQKALTASKHQIEKLESLSTVVDDTPVGATSDEPETGGRGFHAAAADTTEEAARE